MPIKKGSDWAYTISVPNTAGWTTLKLQIEQNDSFNAPDIEKTVTVSNGNLVISGTAADFGKYKDARFRVIGLRAGWKDRVLQSGKFTAVDTEESDIAYVSRPVLVRPEDHGAAGDGVVDDTAALTAAIAALNPGDELRLASGKTYRHSTVLKFIEDNVTITGGGRLLATAEQTSGVWLLADGITVEDVIFGITSTTQRWAEFEKVKLLAKDCTDLTIRHVLIEGSAAAGIQTARLSHFLLDDVTVRDTRSDGVHIATQTSYGRLRGVVTHNTGDDGIAVVSYAGPGEGICHHIEAVGCRSINSSARGFSVVGGSDITYTDSEVYGSTAAGLLISSEAGSNTHPVSRVRIRGGRLVAVNDAANYQGAIVVAGEGATRPVTDVTIEDVFVQDLRTPNDGNRLTLVTYSGAAVTGIQFKRVSFRNCPQLYPENTNLPATAYNYVDIFVDGVKQTDHIGF